MSQCRSTRAWLPEVLRCARRAGHKGRHRCEDTVGIYEWYRVRGGRSLFTISTKPEGTRDA
jgi:hypothetical protein